MSATHITSGQTHVQGPNWAPSILILHTQLKKSTKFEKRGV